jgi:predicted ester cyclase
MAGTIERNKAVVSAFVEAVNARDWERMDDLVAPGFVRHSHAAPGARSGDDLKRFLRAEYQTFPDAHETLEDLLAEGNRVAARHRFRGTQRGPMGPYPPTRRRMEADYIAIYRVEEGLIVEAWAEWDNLYGLVQLGHYQPPARSPIADHDTKTHQGPG